LLRLYNLNHQNLVLFSDPDQIDAGTPIFSKYKGPIYRFMRFNLSSGSIDHIDSERVRAISFDLKCKIHRTRIWIYLDDGCERVKQNRNYLGIGGIAIKIYLPETIINCLRTAGRCVRRVIVMGGR